MAWEEKRGKDAKRLKREREEKSCWGCAVVFFQAISYVPAFG